MIENITFVKKTPCCENSPLGKLYFKIDNKVTFIVIKFRFD